MPLAFARALSPDTPCLLAAVLSGRRRPRHLPRGHRWLKIADRLAAGLPPAAASLPEGDPGLADRLLECPDFRELVASSIELQAEPEAVQRRGLIILARQALERALALDDTGAALFVIEEEMRGRDPAATLADGIRRAQARAARPPAPPEPPPPEPQPPRPRHAGPGYAPGYDPLRAQMQRGSARLRHDIRTEDALRRAAVAVVAAAPAEGVEATRSSAAAATRSTGTAVRPARPAAAPPARAAGPDAPVEPGADPTAWGPRQPRAP